MAATTTQIIVQAIDKFTGNIQKMGDSLGKFQSRLDQTAEHSKKIGLALGAVGVAAGGLGIAMIKAAADTEETMISFETMLGSAENAKRFYEDLVNFAKRTPFELKGLEESSKKLLAFGFTQDEVVPNLKALGDIAAGVGAEKLPNLILAFGQVKAATRLTGMELRQFTEAGVPLLDELAKQFGVTAGQVQEMVSEGQVGFPAVQQALQSLTQDGGRFNNLMDKQADSLNGMISNLKDAWDVFLRGEGQALIDWGKQFIGFAIEVVQVHLPNMIEKIQQVSEFFRQHKEVLVIVAGVIVGALVPAILSAAAAFASAAIALAPFIIGGAIVGGIVAGIIWIVKNWEMIKTKAIDIWQSIAGTVLGFVDSMYEKITTVWNSILNFFLTIFEGIKQIFSFYISFYAGLVLTIFDAMGIDLMAIFASLQEFFVTFWTGLKELFSGMLIAIDLIWTTTWNSIYNFFASLWANIKNVVVTSLQWLAEKFNAYTEPITNAWKTFWGGVGNITKVAWDGIKSVVKEGINWIIEKINWFIRKANEIASKGAGALGISIPMLSEIPKLAEGGIVTQPTIAEVGEAGPEAIIPLRKAGGMGNTVIINLSDNMLLDRDAGRIVGRQIVQELKMSNLLGSSI